MKRTSYIIWLLVILFLLMLSLPVLWNMLADIFIPQKGILWGNEGDYLWVFVGGTLYYFIRKLLKENSRFLETFSHEVTHAFVAICCRKKVYSFHVEASGSGMICTSGNNVYTLLPIALSPYCMPLFAFLLLLIRCFMKENILVPYDVITGMALCFHFYCFKTQIGNHQTDINQYPLVLSYSFIIINWIINLCLVLASFSSVSAMKLLEIDFNPGLIGSVVVFVKECYNSVLMYYNLVF